MRTVLVWIIASTLMCGLAQAGEVVIEGGAPAIEKVLKPIQENFEKTTGIKLKMLPSGPKAALLNLDQGRINAAIGPAFEDWMTFMSKEGAPVKDQAVYQKVVVGQDRIIVITHKDNPVTTLSKEQLRDLFTGNAENWNKVGGPDLPVIIVTGQLIMPAVTIFYNKIMPGEAPAKDQLIVPTAIDVRQAVAANQEAIGIVSYKIADGSVNAPQVLEVPIIFTLLTKGSPSPETQTLIDFLNKK